MSVEAPEKQDVRAQAKYVRVSPRKARLVVDHIRGRSVPEARTVLAFSERAAAREVSKVLRSAIANAETNPGLHWDGDELVIASAFVDEGPTIKRWKARARGRAARIRKRMCHITITLAPSSTATVTRAPEPPAENKPKRAPRRKTAPKAEAEAKPKAEAKPTPKAKPKAAAKPKTTRKKKTEEKES